MRTHGTLTKWNDERGFGFITPAQGTEEVFVHVSAFPRDGARPQVGELVSFEIEPGKDGRRRAVRIQRPGGVGRRPVARRAGQPRTTRRTGFKGAAVALVAVIALGTFGYQRFTRSNADEATAPTTQRLVAPVSEAAVDFQCDGRAYCSQMRSCAEAKYFIRHCPGTKMDGDNDGVPCEQQLCSGLADGLPFH